MQDKALIIQGIHGIRAIGKDLRGSFLLEQLVPKFVIFFSVLQFREEEPNQPETESLADRMVAMRGDRIRYVPIDPLGMRSDQERKL